MQEIGSGTARRQPTGVWEIIGPPTLAVARFIHSDFPHIQDGTPVYFIDLNLDGLCENVQVQLDVDVLVASTLPSNGFAAGAEIRVRNFIMEALQDSLTRTGPARATYRTLLAQKLSAVKAAANALPSRKLTVALLKRLKLTA